MSIPAQTKTIFDPQVYTDLKLKKIIPYNHNTSKFIFELLEGQASLIPVASCVAVRASNPDHLKDDKGEPFFRPFTPISPPDAVGELVLLVKRYEAGNVSKYNSNTTSAVFINTEIPVQEGDTLAFKGPYLKFAYETNQFDEVAFIGGGTGIAPFYQVLTHALKDEANKTKFKLIYSNVSEKDILLRAELDALQQKFSQTFEIVYLVDNPTAEWTGPVGFITADHIKHNVGPASLGDKIKIFVCGEQGFELRSSLKSTKNRVGPPPQVASLAGKKDGQNQGELDGILKDLGYTQEQVFKF
ncbi:hypothetical protein CVT25_015424 [Psilocybe cyanescens]|uniref:NADH-cytochrome b5 reductase n=1 Tax=Psilocybe cyanescens TaxID=93625 RepID=A0A409WHH2_PSICY|nr:hypothetical protein CVT25_015424 [Psilocybe cyanescens]